MWSPNRMHPLLTALSMTFPAWGPGSSAASSPSVRLLHALSPILLTNRCAPAGMTGIVGIFIPFSRTIDLLYAIGGTIIFSGYIVYDTYMINGRLSPDEYIMAAISLYLECVSYPRFLSCLTDLPFPRGPVSSTSVGFLCASIFTTY